jgi:hypothetical protein
MVASDRASIASTHQPDERSPCCQVAPVRKAFKRSNPIDYDQLGDIFKLTLFARAIIQK